MPPYVAIAGNIGSGKSSLAAFLARSFDVDILEEPNEENPFLERFYSDMPRWAFHAQVSFLAHKAAQQESLRCAHRAVVQDRSLWEDAEVFAEHLARKGVLSREEHRTYRILFENVAATLRPPDLILRLRCPVRVLRRRIALRGRAMENALDAHYLRSLDRLYDRWLNAWTLCPILEICTEHWDPVTNLIDQGELLDQLTPLLPLRPCGS